MTGTLHTKHRVDKRTHSDKARANRTFLSRLIVIGLLVFTGAVICGGCSQAVPKRKSIALSNPFTKDRPHRAARMTCIWEPRMLSEKQGIIRGFQGEIVFFRDEKMQAPTIVDGELIVYVYDADDRTAIDLGGGLEGIKPLAEYRFDKETLTKGLAKNKKTKMYSYGVWLPIDKMPGDEKDLVLWSRFEGSGENGELLGNNPGDQIAVYLPGNPVEKKKKQTQLAAQNLDEIRQPVYDDIYDFNGVQLSSYGEAVRAMQEREMRQKEAIRGEETIPLSPTLARQMFNSVNRDEKVSAAANTANSGTSQNTLQTQTARANVGHPVFGGGTTPQNRSYAQSRTPSQPQYPTSRATGVNNAAAVGFGGGNVPSNAMLNNPAYADSLPNNMSPQMVSRHRTNVTSIGAQIDQRMQQGQYALAASNPQAMYGYGQYEPQQVQPQLGQMQQAYMSSSPAQNIQTAGYDPVIAGRLQQVSYVSESDRYADAEASKKAEIRQTMARMMAEQELRRQQANDMQGFSEYNANSFASGQSRITVPQDRYASWLPPHHPQQQATGQPANRFAGNGYPTQGPNTAQPAYVEADWGPGLEGGQPSYSTEVRYSQMPANQIYR